MPTFEEVQVKKKRVRDLNPVIYDSDDPKTAKFIGTCIKGQFMEGYYDRSKDPSKALIAIRASFTGREAIQQLTVPVKAVRVDLGEGRAGWYFVRVNRADSQYERLQKEKSKEVEDEFKRIMEVKK